MNGEETDALRQWVERWMRTGPELERIRAAELGRVDVRKAIVLLEDAFLSALRQSPPGRSSGLVEQQRLFGRLRA